MGIHNRGAGFLLLEMAIAFAILAIFMLAITRLFVSSIEQRADTALYLRMTQQARTLLEETLAHDGVPRDRSVSAQGVTCVLRVRPGRPQGTLPASCRLENTQGFFLIEVTVSAKTDKGVLRSFTFNSGLYTKGES